VCDGEALDEDFHAKSLDVEVATTGKLKWIKKYVPQRNIDYAFFAHYHPLVDELIEKLNKDGLPSLLDPVYQANLTRPLRADVLPARRASRCALPEGRDRRQR